MDYKLIMLPIEAGGTALLDYEPFHHDLMEEAIMHCGREDLVLCSLPVLQAGQYSLHLISDNQDLTDWWDSVKIISDKYAE